MTTKRTWRCRLEGQVGAPNPDGRISTSKMCQSRSRIAQHCRCGGSQEARVRRKAQCFDWSEDSLAVIGITRGIWEVEFSTRKMNQIRPRIHPALRVRNARNKQRAEAENPEVEFWPALRVNLEAPWAVTAAPPGVWSSSGAALARNGRETSTPGKPSVQRQRRLPDPESLEWTGGPGKSES